MAEMYDDFDYVPDDIENEYDYQIKKNPDTNKENKNKDIELSYGTSTNPKKTMTIEDEEYNFDAALDDKLDSKTFLEEKEEKKDEEDEDIAFDDFEDEEEIDKKLIKEKPAERNMEVSYFESSESTKKKIPDIKQNRRIVSEIPQIDQTEFSHIGDSGIKINQSNEKFGNSLGQPDGYVPTGGTKGIFIFFFIF